MKRALLFLGLVVMVGCKSGPAEVLTNPGPATLQPGWKLAQNSAEGVSIGVPSGWRPAAGDDMDALGLGMDPGQFGFSGSGEADYGSYEPSQPTEPEGPIEVEVDEDLKAKGVILTVYDSSRPIPGEERTRYYITKIDHGGNYPLDEAVLDEKEKMLKEGEPVELKLPIGRAMELVSEVKLGTGDKENRISYVLQNGPNTYVLRFISTNNPTAIQQVARPVLETFRVTPKS